MINIEIPYGTGIQIKCPKCGYEGFPNSKKKGIKSFEVLLYICGILPGIAYSIRRKSSSICCCPRCGEVYVKEIDGNDELVNNLIKKNKFQNYAFLAAVLFFILAIFLIREYKLLNHNANQNSNTNNIIDQFQNTMNDNSFAMKDHQESEEKLALFEDKNNETNENINVEEQKDPHDEVREKMQNVLKQIDYKYGEDVWLKQDSYIGSSCSGDCINGIINIEFSENIGWYDFTVKAHSADWSNKIIRAIPGFFDKLQINFICKGQTICSCTFTEYQVNSYAPKGCTYYGYKE